MWFTYSVPEPESLAFCQEVKYSGGGHWGQELGLSSEDFRVKKPQT